MAITYGMIGLFVGFGIGMIAGALIVLWAEMRDGGAWSKGFSDGFDLKMWLRSKGEYPEKRDGNG